MMIKLSPSRLAAVALALAAWLPLQANAGILDDDEARRAILDLRAKVDAMARDLNTRLDAKADKTATLDILNQHEQTMQEIAACAARSKCWPTRSRKPRKARRTCTPTSTPASSKLEPRQEVIDGQTAEVLPTEKQSYDSAMEAIQVRRLQAAASALQDFVRRYPDSAYAANAQYWLGNAYYAQRDYKNAIAAQEVVTNLRHQRQGAGRDAQHRQQLCRAEGQGRPRRRCSSWSRSSRIRRPRRPPRTAWPSLK
jgi:TolA-binding protein